MLFVMELSTRRVEVAGIAAKADGMWMEQVARNLTDAGDGLSAEGDPRIHGAVSATTKVSAIG